MNLATWGWIGLVILLAGYILGIDLYAKATDELTMSAQFHLWMQSQALGPIVAGLWIGVSAAFLYHFLINR